MAKVHAILQNGHATFDYAIFCPGCQFGHGFRTTKHPKWEFNGDMEKPTLHPSLLVRYGAGGEEVCHSFIKDGMIQFLDDCTHALKGQTVPLEDFNLQI